MDDAIWRAIQALDGETFETVEGAKFTVSRYTDRMIQVTPHSSKEPRPVRRVRFEDTLSLGIPVEQLRPGMLGKHRVEGRRVGGFHSSYVIPILQTLRRRGQL